MLVSRVVMTNRFAFARLFGIHGLIPGYLYPGVNLVLMLLSIAWPEPWYQVHIEAWNVHPRLATGAR